MSKTTYITILSFLLISSSLQSIIAVQYKVVNFVPQTPGGKRFDSEIGVPYTLGTMKTINEFIWKVFKQDSAAQRKYVRTVTCNITELYDGAMGEIGGDTVYISESSIQRDYAPRQARFWFTGVMYHEMTHIFQWSGKGTAPGGLTEGIAEYVKIKTKYYDPVSYWKPGFGKRWDEGYGITARFLQYCDGLRDGFTADLNNKMREVYKDEYFKDLLGKSVEQLWSEYKAKYDNKSLMIIEDVKY